MPVPNQDTIIMRNSKQPYDKEHTFSRIHNDALYQAMTNLKGENLKLWLYLIRYKNDYRLELSRADCEKWGLKKTAYYTAKEKLIELHYLVPKEKGSSVYYFYEDLREGEEAYKILSEKPKVEEESKPNGVSIIPESCTREVRNPVHDSPVLCREKQYITIYKNNNTPPTPNPDTLPKVKKEDLDKIPGEKVNMGEEIIYSVFTQKAYRIKE